MCLLVVISRLDSGTPLVVGANRDERLDRPATAMTVLRHTDPRVLGGRDHEAGGTWLAVNEHGVVAGLTNRPAPEGRDPTRRSRGELPLALAQHPDAASAVKSFVARFRPTDYNPSWLLVGDRRSLFVIDMTASDRPHATPLGPGVHILENKPFGAPSAKVDYVRALLGDIARSEPDGTVGRLEQVLADHTIPPGAFSESDEVLKSDRVLKSDDPRASPAQPGDPATRAPDATPSRPLETLAACVHTESYGTRSSTIAAIQADPAIRPAVTVADGHPCTSRFIDVSTLWE